MRFDQEVQIHNGWLELSGSRVPDAPPSGKARLYFDGTVLKLSVDGATFETVLSGPVQTAELAAGVISADATGRALMAANLFNVATVDAKFATGSIGEDRLTANEITGRAVGNIANGNLIGGIPVEHHFAVADSATGNDDYVLTHKTRITEVMIIKTGGAGHATEDTITVKNVADAITEAIVLGDADKAVKRAATIDDAFMEVAAGAILRIARVKGSGGGNSTACLVIVRGVRVA